MTDSAIYQKIRLQFRAHFGDLKSYVFKDMATETVNGCHLAVYSKNMMPI